ncbi:MAG: DJ-1/PfpI family protein [Marinifilaceae bacterium]
MKKIYIYLFEGFSDWEIAYLTPELVKSSDYELVYFSNNGNPLLSMGGLNVTPNISLAEVTVNDAAILILPGGTAWQQNMNKEINALITQMNNSHKPIAAICGATAHLVQFDIFAHVKHTSNALEYLKWIAPHYVNEANYVDAPAVTDGNIITASGIAPIEFAYEIFKLLNLKSAEELDKWFQLFKYGIYK